MFRNAKAFNGDLGSWDTAKVTNLNNMFFGAASFNRDISGWNTSKATAMLAMFAGAEAFDGDISGWNVASVANMKEMFKGASAFNRDLCAWREAFPYTNAEDIFVGSGCAFQATPRSRRRKPFCASSCDAPGTPSTPGPPSTVRHFAQAMYLIFVMATSILLAWHRARLPLRANRPQ